jgi:hypothetical protein
VSTPLRFALRYDPVFLELGRRLGSDEWGKLTGVSIFAALDRLENERELLAFLLLLFGHCENAHRTVSPTLSRSIFIYGSFALSSECVIVGDALHFCRDFAISGSMACSSAMVEFRLGADRVLTFARDETHSYRASFAEGDGERYRRLDETSPGGPVVVRPADDADALILADRLLTTGTLR